MNVQPFGHTGTTTRTTRTVELAPEWAQVARVLIDGAACACGAAALRLTLNVEPSKRDRPKPGSDLHRYGPLPADWTVVAATWCGSTEDDHVESTDTAMTEDDL